MGETLRVGLAMFVCGLVYAWVWTVLFMMLEIETGWLLRERE